MGALVDRFKSWPRAMQWLAIAVALVVVVQGIDRLVIPKANEWSKKADRIESDVESIRLAKNISRDLKSSGKAIANIGAVGIPEADSEGRKALTNVVNQAIEDAGLRNIDEAFDLGRGAPVSTSDAPGVKAGIQERLSPKLDPNKEKLVLRALPGELSVEVTPEDAIKLLTMFEESPEIDRITDVRMVKKSGRNVKLTINLEKWVYARIPR